MPSDLFTQAQCDELRYASRSFYMIRHGETVANATHVAAGAVETPLTELGRSQAEAARLCFEALLKKPTRIVHSALSRARDTASILNANTALPMSEIAALGEHNFGDWVGRPWGEVAPKLLAGETPPNGESRDVFFARIGRAFLETFATFDETLLVVAHGGTFHALVRLFGGSIPDPDNCVLYGFFPDVEGSFPWRVCSYALNAEGKLKKEAVETEG